MPGRKTMDKRKAFSKEIAESDLKRRGVGPAKKGVPSIPNGESQKALKARGFCGAKKRMKREKKENPGHEIQYCRRKAGWGTDHPGIGTCKYHGGSVASHRAGIERKYQIEFMGRPKDISPLDAIIWCIKITAGEVEWLSQEIAKITDKDQWVEFTVAGQQMNVLQRARADAQDRLVRYSKDAIALGLAERSIRLAEQFGATIAHLLEGVARDLKLTREQHAAWPVIVRKHLILLEGGMPVQDEDRKALPRGST